MLGLSLALSPGNVALSPRHEIDRDVIILAAGQSNEQSASAAGQPIDSGLDQDGSGRIVQFRTNATSATAAVQPFTWPANNTNLGPCRAFAMAQALLSRVNPSKKIVIVPAAVGGTKLYGDTWASPGGSLYTGAKTGLTEALADYPGALVVMSWTQGEQDANDGVTKAQYIAAFSAMLAGFRSVSGAGNMLAILHQMVPERFIPTPAELPARVIIDEAHKSLAVSEANCLFLGASLGYQISGDPSHFVSAGHRLAGQRAAARMNDVAYLSANAPEPVTITDNEDGTISLVVGSRPAPAYVIQTREAGSGGAWTDTVSYAPLYQSPGETITLTPTGNGSTEVRVIARSHGGDSAASNTLTMTLIDEWWWEDAIIDLDYTNSRFYVNGTAYASMAAAVSAGAITQTGGIDRVALSPPAGGYTVAATGITSASAADATPRYLIALDDGADGEPTDELVFFAQYLDGSTARNQVAVYAGGVLQTPAPTAWTATLGASPSTAVRIAARLKTNDMAVAFNGGTTQTDNSATLPAVTQLVVANRDDGTRPWGGTKKRIVVLSATYSDDAIRTLLSGL